MQPVQHAGDVLFRVHPLCSEGGGVSGPQYAFSNLRHLQDLPLPLMQQLTSKAQAHSTLCVTPRDTNILSLQVWNAGRALMRQPLMSRWEKKSTKLIYPLEQNVEIRHMPKAIYYFNIPPWLDDVRILMLKPCCNLTAANLTQDLH